MPQPFSKDRSVSWYDRAIMDRPEMAARIGLVTTQWAIFENILAQMFATMLFGPDVREAIAEATLIDGGENVALTIKGTESLGETISLQALGALESLTAKLDVISAVLKPRISDELYLHFQNDLRKDIRRRARERNRVVHGPWALCDDYPDDLIYTRPGEKWMRYTAKDLDNIVTHINETRGHVMAFMILVNSELEQQEAPPAPPQPLLH